MRDDRMMTVTREPQAHSQAQGRCGFLGSPREDSKQTGCETSPLAPLKAMCLHFAHFIPRTTSIMHLKHFYCELCRVLRAPGAGLDRTLQETRCKAKV